MYKKRSNTFKNSSTSRGSKSRGKASDSDDSSSGSSVIVPVMNPARQFIIRESDEEENPRPEGSLEWNWQKNNNTPTIWEYSGTCGVENYVLDQLETNYGLLDLFFIIFDDNLWDIVVTETNRYAEQIMSNGRRRKLDDGWFPITKDEILAYYALCILIAQIKKPNIQMHWSKREVIETPIFAKVMPLKRFTQISRCLHFSNNLTDRNNDRLHKIRPIITYWNEKFNNIYTPKEHISIDESLMRYKGRLIYKQFNPSKRAKFGIKIYKLCEASTGFCSKFKIYTGEDKVDLTDSASESVVMELAESILNKGYTLYIDNWYSSPSLFLNLHKQKTNVIGTVRHNRKNRKAEGSFGRQIKIRRTTLQNVQWNISCEVEGQTGCFLV
ncbi:piggyBac transposable element-derived protein 4-like [Polistes fuscatus]|uniref:piggyBac transposable element-derived protein 4-like n=1 Tax=Polistes fuscatus TaxID=30207 RepID=UPI001CA92E52|nr:piggyBac transposable element-derived protein 4-like [Polistes fuscatus]